MKLVCKICNSEITEISISKTYMVRDDFEQMKSKDFVMAPNEREYFDSTVDRIYYKCKCGEVVIDREVVPEIQDFIRDSNLLEVDDLKYDEYGPLIIEKRYDGTLRKID